MSEMPEFNPASRYSEREKLVAEQLVRDHHADLLAIARSRRRRSRMTDTLMTHDVLHEAYMKVHGTGGYRSVSHFLAVASLAIRQVIVDHARKKLARKRTTNDDQLFLPEFGESPDQLVAIAQLLERLGEENPRWLRIVDARYFAGMTEQETALLLGLSDRTVRRDWTSARAWLSDKLTM
ncbi:MAG: sigma-70 family RNA polymerase sigma factor [Sphingomonadaceae bacterium]|nr:sigma-70 family RNA polymerase sigma factor [Sphingomonadaceae bacterium]